MTTDPAARPAWIAVDADAVTANVRRLAQVVAPAAVCVVVKADGYGHGAVPVARAALAGGASWLAVALPEEARALRGAGIDAAVLVLSEPEAAAFPGVVASDLRATVYTRAGVEAAAAAARRAGTALRVHLKVNTGMNRVGVQPEDVVALALSIERDPNLELEGVWTHLAVADEPDNPFTATQLLRFDEALAKLAAEGIHPPLRHAANSAGALAHPASRYDLVRCGIASYGIAPSAPLAGAVELQPAMSVAARVSFVKRVSAGERVSYGLRHRFGVDTTVATVPLGYADGVWRRLSDVGGQVLIGGRRHPIVGVVTMDQLMVDCGDHPVAPGDEVVLIGSQGDESVAAQEWADLLDTIPYEVVCRFGPRLLPRL